MSAPNIESSGDIHVVNNADTNDFSGTVVFQNLFITPVTPVSVANGATVTLSSAVSYNVLRTTSDGTIAGAVINLPANPVDGQRCTFATTGAITTVTGTVSSAPVPVVAATTAGGSYTFVYNAAAALWFRM
jgi:hypothetical protein